MTDGRKRVRDERLDGPQRRFPVLPFALILVGFVDVAVAISYAGAGVVRGIRAGSVVTEGYLLDQTSVVVGSGFAVGGFVLAAFGFFLFTASQANYFD